MAREPADDDQLEASPIDRRSFIKATGIAAVSAASLGSASAPAAAATGGYGTGGYGVVAFGGAATTTPIAVATVSASETTESTATLVGEVTDLGGFGSADVAFEYRVAGSNAWTRTIPETVAGTGTFSTTLTGLDADTDYSFRAVATANGTTYTGDVRSFTTAAAVPRPVVDDLTLVTSEPLGSDRMLTVKWDVSDPDGDLDTVEVVTAKDISSMNFAVTDVSGANASGWDLFQFPIGTALDVTLRVTDAAGNVTTRTKSIDL